MKKCNRFILIKLENFKLQYKKQNINCKMHKKGEDLLLMTLESN